jgi:hypothetical protein
MIPSFYATFYPCAYACAADLETLYARNIAKGYKR